MSGDCLQDWGHSLCEQSELLKLLFLALFSSVFIFKPIEPHEQPVPHGCNLQTLNKLVIAGVFPNLRVVPSVPTGSLRFVDSVIQQLGKGSDKVALRLQVSLVSRQGCGQLQQL